jgi:tRNA threonylcarbamoyl adenosine modification protein YeaZ
MRVLAIDCATEACSVALFDGAAPVDSAYRVLGRGHAEHLVPMIAALPERGRADRIAVSRGPGSFTGVRIGLAAARALALAWGAEIAGYPTLALIAAMAREQSGAQPVTVAVTGGHGEWFVQEFGADGLPAGDLASQRPEAAAQTAAANLVAGTQAEALVALRGAGEALALLPDARRFPLIPAALVGIDLAPLYGRPPDARLPDARLPDARA